MLVVVGEVELRPAEHHVFEEMGEARLARLDLIARAGLHGDLERDEIGKAGRNDDDFQPVGKSLFRGGEREDLAAGPGPGWGARAPGLGPGGRALSGHAGP